MDDHNADTKQEMKIDDYSRLLAERACERLVVTYTHLIDLGEAGRIAELFTEDGVWESEKRRFFGREQVEAGFSMRQRGKRKSIHVCSNIAIQLVSETEATGITYFILYRNDNSPGDQVAPLIGQQLIGVYHDRFMLTHTGWKFAHRRVKTVFAKYRAKK